MCYPVLVITKSCPVGHPTEATACWRQCNEAAVNSQRTHRWHDTCWPIQPRVHPNQVLPIRVPGHQDSTGEGSTCSPCASLDADANARQLNQKMGELSVHESEYTKGLENIKITITRAAQKMRGQERITELLSLRQSEGELRSLLKDCQMKLGQLREAYSKRAEYFAWEHRNRLYADAIRPAQMQHLRYMAPASMEERQRQHDFPQLLPEVEYDQHPFGIVNR